MKIAVEGDVVNGYFNTGFSDFTAEQSELAMKILEKLGGLCEIFSESVDEFPDMEADFNFKWGLEQE